MSEPSKTEMTASVQGNKSKHTRGYKERYLIKTRQNTSTSFSSKDLK